MSLTSICLSPQLLSHLNLSLTSTSLLTHFVSLTQHVSHLNLSLTSTFLSPQLLYLGNLPKYVTYEWVMSHISMSHVTHINESCHTYQWVMSHVWMSPVTHINESCHTYTSTSVPRDFAVVYTISRFGTESQSLPHRVQSWLASFS